MFIADLGDHEIILGKPWMNQCGLLLNMKNDSLVFPQETPSVQIGSSDDATTDLNVPKPSKRVQILPRRRPDPNEQPFSIHSVGAEPFGLLARQQGVQIFAMSMEDIDQQLQFDVESQVESISLSNVEIAAANLQDIKKKLPSEYHDYLDVFDRAQANQLPPHRDSDHKIELLGDAKPPQSRAYRMPPYKLEKVKEYLTENLSKGFITPSKAPYSSPVLFAMKANGDLRFCVDYRKLNAMTKRNRYPLPLIEEIIGKIIGCKHLTRLDIIAAFNKLRMHPDSEDYTTFITALGAYKYRVLPFGLTNGPSSFQQYINDALWEFLNDFCQAYLDDILIYSRTKREHTRHVRLVLDKLREAGLQVDIKKCEFDVEETVFLGVIVSGSGLRMDPEKVKVIVNWTTPTNLKEVQGFVGFANFYRRFIKDFSKVIRSLVKLTRKDQPFVWDEACSKSFQELKDRVVSAPILRHFDPKKQAVLETDSSDWVTGGVLSQHDDDGVLHPVAFYSKSLNLAEINYHIYDKELLAIIRCFEHWRPELAHTELPIQIFTDHQALKTFMENKQLTRRQARYLDILSDFNFKIIFRAGKANTKADALTRMPGSHPEDDDERIRQQHQTILTPDRVQILANSMDEDGSTFDRIVQANERDELCQEFRKALATNVTVHDGIKLRNCRNVNGVLYMKNRLWVPESQQVKLLQEVHDQPASGHPGKNRTIELIKRFYYWPRLEGTVGRYIRNCDPCQRSKAPRDKTNGLLVPLPVPKQRWRDIAMDFIVGLPPAEGYNAICTIIDRLTKERHYVPCWSGEQGLSAEEVAFIMIWNVFRLHGLPDTIVSDRGSQFISVVWKHMCARLRIKANMSTAFHPPTDGQTERANQDVERHLRTFCNYAQDDWPRWLPLAEFSDNNNVSSSTSMSPFYMNKGFHPRMSFSPDTPDYDSTRERIEAGKADDIVNRMQELLELGQKHMEETRSTMRKQANKHRKEVEYQVGDSVRLSSENIKTTRPSKKLDDRMLGPFKIVEKVGASYRLELPPSMHQHDVFSPSYLRPAANDPLPGQKQEPPRPIVVDDEEAWNVDDILDSRHHYGRLQYKVKWHGLDRDNEWYYADKDEFKHSQEVVDEFHKRYPEKPKPKPKSKPRGRPPKA